MSYSELPSEMNMEIMLTMDPQSYWTHAHTSKNNMKLAKDIWTIYAKKNFQITSFDLTKDNCDTAPFDIFHLSYFLGKYEEFDLKLQCETYNGTIIAPGTFSITGNGNKSDDTTENMETFEIEITGILNYLSSPAYQVYVEDIIHMKEETLWEDEEGQVAPLTRFTKVLFENKKPRYYFHFSDDLLIIKKYANKPTIFAYNIPIEYLIQRYVAAPEFLITFPIFKINEGEQTQLKEFLMKLIDGTIPDFRIEYSCVINLTANFMIEDRIDVYPQPLHYNWYRLNNEDYQVIYRGLKYHEEAFHNISDLYRMIDEWQNQ